MHPRWQQKRLRDYCASVGIVVEAWSPLGAPGQKYGTSDLLSNNILLQIAEKHGKTTAQVLDYWAQVRFFLSATSSYECEEPCHRL